MPTRFELFNAIAHTGSAKVRLFIMERGYKEAVKFRNIIYPEVVADLTEHGGSVEQLPALWDGMVLHEGAEAVMARLQADADVGRF